MRKARRLQAGRLGREADKPGGWNLEAGKQPAAIVASLTGDETFKSDFRCRAAKC